MTNLLSIIAFMLMGSCGTINFSNHYSSKTKTEKKDALSKLKVSYNLPKDLGAVKKGGDINVVIEIPSGTNEKWELDKSDGKLKLEYVDSFPRIIDYLGYPCNYGMVPKTYLPKESGGDNDPLDVLILGDPINRGSIVKCKLIGVLKLTDNGERDDKLIAVKIGTPFYNLNSLQDLRENYKGVLKILELWFTNYKGPYKTYSKGFKDRDYAYKILNHAINSYNRYRPYHLEGLERRN